MSQQIFCMLAMLANNLVWVRRQRFIAKWHIAHFFIAATIIELLLPRSGWWPLMTNSKYLCTAMNVLAFQTILGRVASLTEVHHLVVMLVTLVDLMISTKAWFAVELEPVAVWDICFHAIAPLALLSALATLTISGRLEKDWIAADEYEAIKKVLSSLSQGVALTVDFPSEVLAARQAAKKTRPTQYQSQKSNKHDNEAGSQNQSLAENRTSQ